MSSTSTRGSRVGVTTLDHPKQVTKVLVDRRVGLPDRLVDTPLTQKYLPVYQPCHPFGRGPPSTEYIWDYYKWAPRE